MQGVDELPGSQTMVNSSVLLRSKFRDMHFRLHLASESESPGLGSVCFRKHPGDKAHSALRVNELVTQPLANFWTFLVLNYSTGKTVPCRVIVRSSDI